MIDQTIDFYDKNAKKLIVDYDNADMTSTYKCIEKYLHSNYKVLDIGSGRDIKYFNSKKMEIYGIDASEEFIKISKERYPHLQEFVYYSELPNIDIPNIKNHYFYLTFSMATWMHVPKFFENLNPNKIKKLFKENAFKLIDTIQTKNGLNRSEINWITQVYKLL